jgi:beta-aspartyl-peptidase (threonine type)
VKSSRPVILAHGGAGVGAMTAAQRACLAEALAAGYAELIRGAPALRAVEITIRALEGSGLFNAGVGSVLQLDGGRRMDASIMEGRELRAGAVSAVEGVRYPITVARLVMEQTDHVLLMGKPATRFARHFGVDRQPAPTAAQRKASRSRDVARASRSKSWALYEEMMNTELGVAAACETVGAVALDVEGHLAAGASTGGAGIMLPGRVGDTPQIGSGVYADDEAGAVSMTGRGEGIIRIVLAKDIVDRLAAGSGPATAARLSLHKLASRIKGSAGALVLAPDGRFAIRHNTPRMAAGHWTGKGRPFVADRFR